MKDVFIGVRVSGDLADRVDALGKRSVVVREALEAFVGGEGKPDDGDVWITDCDFRNVSFEAGGGIKLGSGGPVVIKGEEFFPDALAGDPMTVLKMVRDRGPSWPRDLKRELGWLGIRFENAERVLLSEGFVRSTAGLLEAV